MSPIYVLSHTHHERRRQLCNTVHTGTSQTSHIALSFSVAVIPMNYWRQEPANQRSLYSVPARKPRSNKKKVAYFYSIMHGNRKSSKDWTCCKRVCMCVCVSVCVSLDLGWSGCKQISYTFRIEYTALNLDVTLHKKMTALHQGIYCSLKLATNNLMVPVSQ